MHSEQGAFHKGRLHLIHTGPSLGFRWNRLHHLMSLLYGCFVCRLLKILASYWKRGVGWERRREAWSKQAQISSCVNDAAL